MFTDFKRTIYVDRLPPESAVVSFDPFASEPEQSEQSRPDRPLGRPDRRQHAHSARPAGEPDRRADPRAGESGSNQAGYYDRDQFIRGFTGVNVGNHVATVVTFEPTGNYNIQRFPGCSRRRTTAAAASAT